MSDTKKLRHVHDLLTRDVGLPLCPGDEGWTKTYEAALGVVNRMRFAERRVAELEREIDEALQLTEACSTLRQMSAACVEGAVAKAQVEKLERERDALRVFVEWCLREGSWQGCNLDGGDMQDRALELGLIEPRAVDPTTNDDGTDTLYFCTWTPKP